MNPLEKEVNWPMFEWKGNYYPRSYMIIENMMSVEKMEPKEGDIFLSSYPRSGSMWTQAIIWSILNPGKDLPERLQVEFPQIELLDINFLENIPSPRTFKTHLASSLLPISSSAKYICIVRNIYDCCLSLYDFFRKNTKNLGGENYISLDRHVECFVDGILPIGNYFDLCQSWYDLKEEPNVLFLIYEDQREDIKSGILKIAKFLGQSYCNQISASPEILDRIIKNTGINSMKESKSYRFPVKEFSEELENKKKTKDLGTVPLTETNSFKLDDLIFKGEVGRAQRVLTQDHRGLLKNALEEKVKSKELSKILGKYF